MRITDLLSDIRYIFMMHEDIWKLFSSTIEYFKRRGVLFICANDKGDQTQLYLAPRGRMLWELLGINTILLDLYREDLWLDEDVYDLTGTLRLSVDERLVEEMNLIQSYASEEIKILGNLKTKQAKMMYRNCFGSDTIAKHLFGGVRNSIMKVYQDRRPEVIATKLTETFGLVERAKKELERVHD